MHKISPFGEDLLLTALRINKHIDGYIDFYYGPEKLRQIVENESLTSPSKLLITTNDLLKKLSSQGYDINRECYLEKNIIAMRTSIELLKGIEFSIEDQFLRIFDVVLPPADESELKNLKEEYDEAYDGPGSLEERLNILRVTRKVPESKALNFFEKALDIVKKHTKKIFSSLLPEEEQISIDVVEKSRGNIKWSYYNWYLGNYHSRIEINPKYAMYWTSILSAASHEGYPGHHTEFVVNERKLYHELNHYEHSVLVLHSPKMIITEGIANMANSMLFSNKESAEIGLREFCIDESEEASLEKIILQDKLKLKIPIFWYNFAYHALIDKYNEAELIEYGKNLFNDEVLKMELKRLSNPAYSKNAFLYYLGTSVLKQKFGNTTSVKEFRNLIENPTLPSDLI